MSLDDHETDLMRKIRHDPVRHVAVDEAWSTTATKIVKVLGLTIALMFLIAIGFAAVWFVGLR